MNSIDYQLKNAVNAHPQCVRLLYKKYGLNSGTMLNYKTLNALYEQNPNIINELNKIITYSSLNNGFDLSILDDILNIVDNNTNDKVINDNTEAEKQKEKLWLIFGFGFLLFLLLLVFIFYKINLYS